MDLWSYGPWLENRVRGLLGIVWDRCVHTYGTPTEPVPNLIGVMLLLLLHCLSLQVRNSAIVDGVPMPLRSRYTFALAPVNSHEHFAAAMLLRFAEHFSDGGYVEVGLDIGDAEDEERYGLQ